MKLKPAILAANGANTQNKTGLSKMTLTPLQNEIQLALTKLGDRSRFSEAILAKTIREKCKIEGKKKAGITLADLEKAAAFLEETTGAQYSFMLNSANDLLIEKTENKRLLEGEVRQRRLKSEKAMSVFTNSDVTEKNKKSKPQARTVRKAINIYSDFEDLE